MRVVRDEPLSSRKAGPEWEGQRGEAQRKGWVALQLPWNLEAQRGCVQGQRPLGCSSWGCSQVSLPLHSCSVGTQATRL